MAQRAEIEHAGVRCGIMDQMASSLADTEHALFLDTRTLGWERVALPQHVEVAVIDSGVTHRHASGGYRRRRAECEDAAARLGVPALRDVGVEDLPRVRALPPPLDRRARHVVTENARVLEAVAALRAGDAMRVGALLAASHASMRDDFEVSIDEIDLIVRLAGRDRDVYGARLTGGGFGGAVVILARSGAGGACVERITRAYESARRGRHAS
jgi:galactokinase